VDNSNKKMGIIGPSRKKILETLHVSTQPNNLAKIG
jgi:hypothetical protein